MLIAVPQGLLSEHRDLELVLRTTALAMGATNHREYGKRIECRPRDEDALGIRAHVGRVDQESVGSLLGKIIGHEAFDDFVIFKLQAHPEAFGSGTAGEG